MRGQLVSWLIQIKYSSSDGEPWNDRELKSYHHDKTTKHTCGDTSTPLRDADADRFPFVRRRGLKRLWTEAQKHNRDPWQTF